MANNPMTRKEIYLAKMAGEDVSVPEPMTREETYLKKIAENGGSGGGGGAFLVSMNMETSTLDKTWNEIKNSEFAVITVQGADFHQWMMVGSAEIEGDEPNQKYNIYGLSNEGEVIFSTDSADGYPVFDTGENT